MRRGPGGGLVTENPSQRHVVASLAMLLSTGCPMNQLSEARRVLANIAERVTCENPALTRLAGTLEALSDYVRRAETGSTPNDLHGDFTARFGDSRAERIARDLICRLRVSPLPEGTRLGCEADLYARYDVGTPVARQVIRLLEESGLVECQRGRGRGLFLRTTETDSVMHMLASSLVSCGVTLQSSWELGQLLNVELVVLAAAAVPTSGKQPLTQLLTRARPEALTNAAEIIEIDWTVDRCSPNPILVTILGGLKLYSRLRNRDRDTVLRRFANECGPEFLASTRAVATAILSGDCRAAAQAQRDKNELFAQHLWRQH
jgi:DNA-binding FadR family transcriptional regulator